MSDVTEVQILPIKPTNGLVAFASIVIDGSMYLGSIAVYVRPDGSFRITYPTKKVGLRELQVFHPINRLTGQLIENAIIEKCNEVFKGSDNDRHSETGYQDER
ncbi:septation protein SpoVG family protein [Candidatus Saccharibacteria bacterium]|nr:septation protein SpoVG family protein [Candidatus Saccharibacteria bacterium]